MPTVGKDHGAVTTTHRIKNQEKTFNLQILTMLWPGELNPMLIKPQAPLLVVPFRHSFKFQAWDHTTPEPKDFDFW